jgi:hypothetical protein
VVEDSLAAPVAARLPAVVRAQLVARDGRSVSETLVMLAARLVS